MIDVIKYKGWYFRKGREKNYRFSTIRVKSLEWVFKNWDRKNLCVQAGGSYGVWPKMCSDFYSIVYTFEPEFRSFYVLNLNCDCENIYKINMALSNKNGLVNFSPLGYTEHHINKDKKGTTPAITIDSLNLDCCDSILLDVERYEYEALCGAINTIKKYSPLILFEDLNGGQEGRIDIMLKKLNYTMVNFIDKDKIYVKR